ncbi:MAG: MCE family protein [Roseomonas sp.]|nr:MCE family protein [Roseomonas sp.]MCA3288527.1 MCE family protein [Roseomonas sp.]MCA3292036.1 MCE family protein [Roseomonas sp.]MCA3295337.1 MCE family protein [Roseomonas sp.]
MAKPPNTLFLRVGMLALSAIALAVGFIVYLTAGQFGTKSDYFETYVGESIVGLDIGAAVRFRGVQIGRVTEISLAAAIYDVPEARTNRAAMQLVVIRFAVDRARVSRIASLDDMIAGGLRTRIASQGITGVTYLEIDILDPARFPPMQVPWKPRYEHIPAVPSTITQVTSAAEQILRRLEKLDIEGLVNNAAGLMGDLRRQVSDGEVATVLREAGETMAELRAEIRKARLEDTTNELRGAIASMGDAGRSAQELLASREVRDALVRIPAAVTALEQTLRTARGTTTDLQADLSPLMRDLRSSVANLRDTTEALRRNPSQTLLGAPPPPPNRERR